MTTRPHMHKSTLEVPRKLWNKLVQTALSKEVTASELLRRSLWVFLFLCDRTADGWEVRLHKDGVEQRLVLEVQLIEEGEAQT